MGHDRLLAVGQRKSDLPAVHDRPGRRADRSVGGRPHPPRPGDRAGPGALRPADRLRPSASGVRDGGRRRHHGLRRHRIHRTGSTRIPQPLDGPPLPGRRLLPRRPRLRARTPAPRPGLPAAVPGRVLRVDRVRGDGGAPVAQIPDGDVPRRLLRTGPGTGNRRLGGTGRHGAGPGRSRWPAHRGPATAGRRTGRRRGRHGPCR